MEAKKSLGQHWLKDEPTLISVCESADIGKNDTVLEIGPGQGDLTRQLVKRAGRVIAVELDDQLARALPKQITAQNLEVIRQDILKFDLTTLPAVYKVVANIPYYLTSNLLRTLSESNNPPQGIALLVQKEVAERVAAGPGQMSVLSVSVQLYYQAKLGPIVPAELFQPPPKIDSQVIILQLRPEPLFKDLDAKLFFRIVKAGFAGRRKKLSLF
ncbi:16S rRNA (adenine(1518)-N(6)/adenine(1519)-N(6))-dimethyltransferase RsmA, partial [Candidatus Saccharibacteria bacterium]|nr:16S rRNA (adenine(1518)-N(6)/adenine(1519)-N(6))-dimethyltransferase RsmA [Candidatus Saccharibacteria bacterium]